MFISLPTHTNNLLDLDSLSNSLIRELKIRFVGLVLKKLFIHDKFQL